MLDYFFQNVSLQLEWMCLDLRATDRQTDWDKHIVGFGIILDFVDINTRTEYLQLYP